MDKLFTTNSFEYKEEGEQGIVRAVFATLNVVDHDGDVTLPGAFGEQDVKLAAWGHKWHELPVGRGRITEEGDKAIFDGAFFLNTAAGMEHYRTVKGLAELQEWSYGFDIEKSSQGEFEGTRVQFLKKLKVHEVSPVMRGVGMETETVAIKGWTYADHAEHALASVQAFVERSRSLADLRAKEGRPLSVASRERLMEMAAEAAALKAEIDELIKESTPGDEKALGLLADFEHAMANINRLRVQS